MLGTRWFDVPPPQWGAIEQEDPDASFAHMPGLAIALAATQPGCTAAWIAVEDDGVLVGGAPVVIERRGGFHWVHALPWSLPGTPLARPGRHAEVDSAVAAALAERISDLRAVGGAWVVPRWSGPALAPAALDQLPGETRFQEAAVVDLAAGVDAAWERVDRDARQSIRAARRHGIAVEEEAGAVEVAYALYALQARGWAAHRPRPLELWRRLLAPGPSRVARLFVARDARGPLSAVLVLVSGRDALLWLTGSCPEARRRQAYRLLLWSVAEACAATGVVRVGLGASAGRGSVAELKAELGASTTRVPVRWIDGRNAGPLGRRIAWAQSRWQAGRERGDPR